jgi:hypothetical protein
VRLKIDWYTKFILIVIAINLLGLLLRPIILPQMAIAARNIQDVNIAKIDGHYIGQFTPPINVRLKEK